MSVNEWWHVVVRRPNALKPEIAIPAIVKTIDGEQEVSGVDELLAAARGNASSTQLAIVAHSASTGYLVVDDGWHLGPDNCEVLGRALAASPTREVYLLGCNTATGDPTRLRTLEERMAMGAGRDVAVIGTNKIVNPGMFGPQGLKGGLRKIDGALLVSSSRAGKLRHVPTLEQMLRSELTETNEGSLREIARSTETQTSGAGLRVALNALILFAYDPVHIGPGPLVVGDECRSIPGLGLEQLVTWADLVLVKMSADSYLHARLRPRAVGDYLRELDQRIQELAKG